MLFQIELTFGFMPSKTHLNHYAYQYADKYELQRLPAFIFTPGAAQGFGCFQNAGQAFFPGAFAFKAGFYFAQAQGCACAGQ